MQNSSEGKFSQEKSFVVSERSYETILKNCHLEDQDIRNLPENAIIVEVGSGEFQEFARGVRERRPDVKIISIDPTLSFSPRRKGISISESGDSKTYYIKNQAERRNRGDILRYREIQKKRMREADKGAVAAFAPSLPFYLESIDLLIDSYGPTLYLRKEEFLAYAKEIAKVLKPGGHAQLFPIGCVAPPFFFTDKKEFEQVAMTQLHEIFQGVEGVEAEPFFGSDGVGIQIRRKVVDK